MVNVIFLQILARLPVLKEEEQKERHHLQVAARDAAVAKDVPITVVAQATDAVLVIIVAEVRIVAARTAADREARTVAVTQAVVSEERNN